MNQWKPLYNELRGAIKDKYWVGNGVDVALFKPDSELKESLIEYEVAKIANQLDIPCARTEIIELNGQIGTLSYNFKTDASLIYCPADQLYLKSDNVTYQKKDTQSNYLPRISRLSVGYIRENIPQLQEGVAKMLFLDCLVSNRDRHGNNWELMMDKGSNILGVAPLFDHGLSLWNNYDDMMDYSMVLWDESSMELKHYEMFEKLLIHYPKEINNLMDKCAGIDLDDFVAKRFKYMKLKKENINSLANKIKDAGYPATEKLIMGMKKISGLIGEVKSVEGLKDLYGRMDSLSKEQKNAVVEVVNDFASEEKQITYKAEG